jgi:uncharacterized protein YegL
MGSEADLYVIETPDGERVLRLNRGSFMYRPEVAERLDAIGADLGGGVVRTFERGTDEETGRRYEIQEYLPLGDLSEVMAEGPMKVEDVRRLCDSLSLTLDRLHSGGIVHRDVKPANILLRSLDPVVPALCDFGISVALPEGIPITETQAAFTVLYSSPESLFGIACYAGDFWSLGAVLLEALCGHHPLANLSESFAKMEIAREGLRVPHELEPEGDAGREILVGIIKGLLVRRHNYRWHRAEVRAALVGNPPPLPPPAVPHPVLGEQVTSPEEVAFLFNLDAQGWEMGTADIARGMTLSWLIVSGMNDAVMAMEREREDGLTLHERLFAFIRKFAPQSPPAFRGVTLTQNNMETLLHSHDDPPEGGRQVLDAMEDGTLKNFPAIAERLGTPLAEPVALLLSRGGIADLKTMASALAAMSDPDSFIWGNSGPRRGIDAMKFVLDARYPLMTKLWWEENVPAGMTVPSHILESLMDAATYARGAAEVMEAVKKEEATSLAKRIRRFPPPVIQTRWPRQAGKGFAKVLPVYILRDDSASMQGWCGLAIRKAEEAFRDSLRKEPLAENKVRYSVISFGSEIGPHMGLLRLGRIPPRLRVAQSVSQDSSLGLAANGGMAAPGASLKKRGVHLGEVLDYVTECSDSDFALNVPESSQGWNPLVFIFSGSPSGDDTIPRVPDFKACGWEAVECFALSPEADRRTLREISGTPAHAPLGFSKKDTLRFLDSCVTIMHNAVMGALT